MAANGPESQPSLGSSPETTPEQMARDAVAVFVERFEWVQDDLRALVLGVRVIEVDGTRDARAVAEHFSPYLPASTGGSASSLRG